MTWNIEDAQQHFSEILTAVEQAPQLLYQHNNLVAAVIRADLFQEFLAWQAQQQSAVHEQGSFAQSVAELRRLCLEEDYTLEVPTRGDRPNPFTDIAA
ncbi:MAG: type II toxin-antitoxin system Phd/YefM family antitoxin [Oculatellaceae cyanobacterium Prado106]|jgi:hypothetical protein|nr:type II toxin-antitoxin system Phd/YefM family antitoxin [Oculatellaceae cyanobacterium Prado106]